MDCRKVVIVAPHYTPSNLTAVHRARLWSLYLNRYGWEPIIVTVHWRHYEEELDWDLHGCVPSDVRVLRTRALPTRPIRLFGDIGLRGLPWLYLELRRLIKSENIDFLHITIPSNYAALLGRLIYRRFHLPYGIDYIDPWVHEWPAAKKPLSKAWWSLVFAKALEPWAVRHASLITGVASSYYADVLQRNPHLKAQVVTAAMPYGIAASDFDHAMAIENDIKIFDKTRWNMVYAGAMLPHSFGVLEALFGALVKLTNGRCRGRAPCLHFIGTGKGRDRTEPSLVKAVSQYGLQDHVKEHPKWLPYLSVLKCLKKSDAILILGSDRQHYTPSKVYQAILSGNPIFAILQRSSETVNVLKGCDRSTVVTFDRIEDLDTQKIESALRNVMQQQENPASGSDPQLLDLVSAESSARRLAEALNEAVSRKPA